MSTKTSDVMRQEGVGYWWLMTRIRSGKLPPPRKDSSGDFVWSDEDIARVRQLKALPKRQRRAAQAV
jgi:hypothetical protein